MNYFKKSIIFMMIIYSIKCLNTRNFCKLNQSVCINGKNNYCIDLTCPHPYIHKCGPNKCSSNKNECDIFSNSLKLLESNVLLNIDSFRISNTKMKIYQNKHLEQLRSFGSKIPECPQQNHTLTPSEICLNNKNCVKTINLNRIFFQMHSNIKFTLIECPCPIGKTFKCGNHCTVDNIACIQLIQMNFKLNIQNCKNNQMILQV